MQTGLRAVLYGRVSTDEQAENGTSLEEQHSVNLKKAQEMSATVVAQYEDAGVSGAKYKSRPGLMAALRDIETGKANLLIAPKVDRIGRSAEVVLAVSRRVGTAGGELVTADGMNFGSSAVGRLMLNQLAGFAEFERGLIRERTSSGSRRRARSGVQVSRAISPYGYHVVKSAEVMEQLYPAGSEGTYIVVEEQAQWVREMYTRYAAGFSLDKMAKWLYESGVPSPTGRPTWSRKVLRGVLMNPVYKGQAVYARNEWQRGEDEAGKEYVRTRVRPENEWITIPVTPIVDEGVWDICNRRLKEANALFSGKNSDSRYMLSGLLRCKKCQKSMGGHNKSKGWGAGSYFQYYCPRAFPSKSADGQVCTRKIHHGPNTDALILAAIEKVASSPEILEKAFASYDAQTTFPNSDTRKQMEQELRGLDEQEAATVRAQVDALAKNRNTAVYDGLLDEIDRKRRSLKARLGALEPADGGAPKRPKEKAELLSQALADVAEVVNSEDLTPAEKRRALVSVVEKIEPQEIGCFDIHFRDEISTVTCGGEQVHWR